ncbi:hypothetical protein G9A89_007575 [Geosiphon pyriformis]|nr:hypothetical protein G9A89_007575 [Geosiphon pyriformis]
MIDLLLCIRTILKAALEAVVGLDNITNTVVNIALLYKNFHIDQSKQGWVKPQPIKDKLELYTNVRAGKETVASEAPANIIDQAIDQTFLAREEVIRRNPNRQEVSKIHIECFYIIHLCNPSMLTTHRYKPTTILDNDMRALLPLNFKKKRHNNGCPVPPEIMLDGKLTYYRKTNEWKFIWVYQTQKQHQVMPGGRSLERHFHLYLSQSHSSGRFTLQTLRFFRFCYIDYKFWMLKLRSE